MDEMGGLVPVVRGGRNVLLLCTSERNALSERPKKHFTLVDERAKCPVRALLYRGARLSESYAANLSGESLKRHI